MLSNARRDTDRLPKVGRSTGYSETTPLPLLLTLSGSRSLCPCLDLAAGLFPFVGLAFNWTVDLPPNFLLVDKQHPPRPPRRRLSLSLRRHCRLWLLHQWLPTPPSKEALTSERPAGDRLCQRESRKKSSKCMIPVLWLGLSSHGHALSTLTRPPPPSVPSFVFYPDSANASAPPLLPGDASRCLYTPGIKTAP